MKYKYILVQTVIGDYRKSVFDCLVNKLGDSFHVIAGNEYFTDTIKTKIEFRSSLTIVKNHFLFGRKVLFQTGLFFSVIKADKVIFELNPRIITNWLFIIIRKLIGKRNVLWGHAWPRKGKNQKSDQLRQLMRILGDTIIVYTETQKRELNERMANKQIIAAPNALYSKAIMKANESFEGINNIIYVGRLVPEKKPLLLVEAFSICVPQLSKKTNLLIVGEGPEKRKIERIVRDKNLEKRIKVMGHISDAKVLAGLYASSLVSVSPGYVGLSIIQSFAFGIPMIISRFEAHAPEIEAARENDNCLMFDTDSATALSEKISNIFLNQENWMSRRKQIAEVCCKRYSVEAMSQRIQSALYT